VAGKIRGAVLGGINRTKKIRQNQKNMLEKNTPEMTKNS